MEKIARFYQPIVFPDRAPSSRICKGQTVLGIFFPGRIYHRDHTGAFQRAPGSRLVDYLILTDENVVFWERGESGQRTGYMSYPEILDVECQTGPVFGDLIITARNSCVKLGDVPSKGVLHI